MSSSSRGSFLLSSPRSLAKGLGIHQHGKDQIIGGQVVSQRSRSSSKQKLGAKEDDDVGASASDKFTEGFLFVRIHVRRLRYCVLRGRMLLVFDNKEEAASAVFGNGKAAATAAKKVITVVGVRSATEIEKSVRASLLGIGSHVIMENALVISTQKSKLVLVEAETPTEKQRWLHAMSCLNFASSTSERAIFLSMLQDDGATFDAHVAVSLLHKYRDNEVATELIIDRLAEYAENNVDDVEFYIQQIMHLVVNTEMVKTEKLVNLLLSICKAKAYVEHLGNSIHLALQLFWLLEAKIEDKDPRTYNLCAKLLMSIEAKVVNQHFELPVSPTGSSAAGSAVSTMLMEIPGMKARLEEMTRATKVDPESQGSAVDDAAKVTSTRPGALVVDTSHDIAETEEASVRGVQDGEGLSHGDVLSSEELVKQRELLLQWMEKERQKRYRHFHQQRDFVKALADISEKMRLIDPPQERKKHLPSALETLTIPEMAYIPLGRVSDPFCRITRVLKDEGTVFSTHSRAPCLLCFEVIEDQVNAAGQRSNSTIKSPAPLSPANSSSGSILDRQGSAHSSRSFAFGDEAEIVAYIKQFSINGKFICVEQNSGGGEAQIEDSSSAVSPRSDDGDATYELERQLGVVLTTSDHMENGSPLGSRLPLPRETSLASTGSTMYAKSSCSSSGHDEASLIHRRSQSAYEFGLSKMLSEGGMFGESWQEKKVRHASGRASMHLELQMMTLYAPQERIRAASPHGHLPGWNVISLVRSVASSVAFVPSFLVRAGADSCSPRRSRRATTTSARKCSRCS